MRTPRIGLALGGGAARGWAHIGVLEALEEAGIRAELIAGTSMGALVGGAYAAGRLDALKTWALTVDWGTVLSLLDVNLSTGGLIDGRRIQRLLRDLGIVGDIQTLPIPFAAVATDLRDGGEVWMRTGSLETAIRASIALPGIFGPAFREDRWLADGGMVNQVPVSTVRALGADLVIAVNVDVGLLERHATAVQSAIPKDDRVAQLLVSLPAPLRAQAERLLPQPRVDGPKPPAYLDVVTNAINIMQERITRSRLAGDPPSLMIAPRVATIGLMEFDRAAEAIAAGRRAVRHALPALRDLLGVTAVGDLAAKD